MVVVSQSGLAWWDRGMCAWLRVPCGGGLEQWPFYLRKAINGWFSSVMDGYWALRGESYPSKCLAVIDVGTVSASCLAVGSAMMTPTILTWGQEMTCRLTTHGYAESGRLLIKVCSVGGNSGCFSARPLLAAFTFIRVIFSPRVCPLDIASLPWEDTCHASSR